MRSNNMANRSLSIIFAVVTVFLPLAAHAQTGCLSGSVVDNIGQPVKGIRITVGDNIWTTAQISPEPRSDESGQFRIEGIPPGNYKANAFDDQLGYPGIWWPVRDVSIAASTLCTNIVFNVHARAAKLKLIVTDATTNKPIPNLLLHVFPGEKAGLWLTVEPLLSYGLPPQVPSLVKLRVVVTARGYSSSEFVFPSLVPGETREIVTKLSPKGLGCITGAAVDESDSPVAAAKISPRFMGSGYAGDVSQPVTADDNGKFTFDNLRPGDYVLWPEKESDGFSTNWSGWHGQVELQRVTVAPGGACQEVRLNMGARGAIMRVRAMDDATHEPLQSIQVNFRNAEDTRQGGSITGEPRDVHEFLVPSRTNFILQVRSPGYRASEPMRVGPLSPGETQDLTVPLQRETTSSPVPPSGD
ncbi:MAG: carboxypeptidase-like regulatory domain-containing protein [Terriglobales bacterium]